MFRKLLLILALFASQTALSGAWDVGAFDNDDALDWVIEVSESGDIDDVRSALERVANRTGYLQVTDANYAMAAAEIVAALNGNPNPMFPDELAAWISANDFEPDPELTALAKRAVLRVLDLKTSELAQLWSDSPETAEMWNAEISHLSSRLE